MILFAQDSASYSISLGNFLTVLSIIAGLLIATLGRMITMLGNIKESVAVLVKGADIDRKEIESCQLREKTAIEALWKVTGANTDRINEIEKHGSPATLAAINAVNSVETRLRALEMHGAEPVRERMATQERRIANLERYSVRGSGHSENTPEDEGSG